MTKIAMQTKCIYCLHEQHAPLVYGISRGKHPCWWCGLTPPKLTQEEYEEIIKQKKDETKS